MNIIFKKSTKNWQMQQMYTLFYVFRTNLPFAVKLDLNDIGYRPII